MGEFHILYSLTSLLVKIYKWLELKLLLIFTSRLERKLRGTYKKLGIKFFGAGVTQRLATSETAENEIVKRAPSDLQVNDKRFYSRIANHASLGMGETYMVTCLL